MIVLSDPFKRKGWLQCISLVNTHHFTLSVRSVSLLLLHYDLFFMPLADKCNVLKCDLETIFQSVVLIKGALLGLVRCIPLVITLIFFSHTLIESKCHWQTYPVKCNVFKGDLEALFRAESL